MDEYGDLRFCPELQRMLVERSARGRSGKNFESLASLSTRNNVFTLRQMILEFRPERTLEVGLAHGGSALAIAAAHRDLGRPARQQHIALDPFQSAVWDESGILALEVSGLRTFVDFRQQYSWLALPRLMDEDIRVGLAYIDGSHLFEDVLVDWFLVSRILEPGGIVAFDDCTDPHVAKLLRFVRSNLGAQFEEMDLQVFRPDSLRNRLRYSAAALLGKRQLRAFRLLTNPARRWDSELQRF